MLTTRCPGCRTTFRIKSQILHRAEGQVRCGQCQAVFDAFETLADARSRTSSVALQPVPAADAAPARPPSAPALPQLTATQTPVPVPQADAPDAATPAATPDAFEPTSGDAPAPLPPKQADDEQRATQSAGAPAAPAPEAPAPEATIPEETAPEAVTRASRRAREPAAAHDTRAAAPGARDDVGRLWHPEQRQTRESAGWRVAAAVAACALLLQAVHQFRTPLSRTAFLGTALERGYAALGRPIEHRGDPQDFSIVDWAATAQSVDPATPGSLEITAGVRNESNAPLQYPLLSLELTDRWEAVIGSRVFLPEEYMGTRMSQNAMIDANATVTAHLSLVDPGPDAYGFELDVCVAAGTGLIRCKTDATFR